MVVVVTGRVVVVAGDAMHPLGSHPDGTLCAPLTHAETLDVGLQWAASDTTRWRVTPSARTRQQTTLPARPQVDCFA
jgi:hypothetical protein